MSLTIGSLFKMTFKTRLFLWLYKRFEAISQWFIKHCDYTNKFSATSNTQPEEETLWMGKQIIADERL